MKSLVLANVIVWIPGDYLLNGWVLMTLWGMFVVPALPDIPALSIVPAIGLLVIARFIIHQGARAYELGYGDMSDVDKTLNVMLSILGPVFMEGIRYLALTESADTDKRANRDLGAKVWVANFNALFHPFLFLLVANVLDLFM
ncbi:hypothetical protein KJ605_01900 [Patescibacteria group bacterium]|nr:hypothetical protein [Patescibacteria group bacterium]MBU1970507.1 hypothetical protein [Patescibacteria group bacterium]